MTPPRLARWLLRRLLDQDRRDDVAGDLAEEFADRARDTSPQDARRWYRGQVAGFAARRLLRPPRWWSPTDVRLAVRQARRQPVATTASVLALSAVIALSVGTFTFARAFVLPDLGLPGGDRLGQVRMSRPVAGSQEHPYPGEVLAWANQARTVESVGAFQFASPTVQVSDDDSRPADGAFITPTALARLAPAPLRGRLLADADAAPGAAPVVLIAESFWRSRLSADPGVIGREIQVSGERRTIVGVMPDGFGFPVMQRIWMPLSVAALDARSSANLIVWITRAPGQSARAVEAELTAIARSLAPEAERAGTTLSVLPYVDGFTGGLAAPLAAIALTLLLVLLAAVSLNVANLTLARCAARAVELDVRAALGASRGRLIGQLFIEALVTAVIAAVIGIVAVDRALAWVRAAAGGGLAFWLNPVIDPWVAAYAIGLALVASVLTGVVPALRVTRRMERGVGGRVTPAALGRFAAAMLAIQVAASTALLATAGLLGEGLLVLSRTTPVTDASKVTTAVLYYMSPPGAPPLPWGSPELYALRLNVESALRSLPGVERASLSLSVPGADQNVDVFEAERRPGSRVRAQSILSGPDFLETLGAGLHTGRTIAAADARPGVPDVAVVSERFAAAAFGAGGAAVGQRIRSVGGSRPGPWMEVVGVAAEIGLAPGDRRSHGEVLTPMIGTTFMYASMRTPPAPQFDQALRSALAQVDPRIRVTDIQPLADVGWQSRATLAAGAAVLSLVGGLTLLLSLAGIYALSSLAVTTRTREIGIRLALGATGRLLLRPVIGRTVAQLLLGSIAGAIAAIGASQLLTQLPFAIPLSAGIVLPATGVALLAAGLAALSVPARRALRLSPTEALRAD